MEKEQILKEVTQVYRKILKQENLILTYESSANSVQGWDSLNHTILMAEVQKHFKVSFALKEVIRLKNVGDMIDLLDKKLTP